MPRKIFYLLFVSGFYIFPFVSFSRNLSKEDSLALVDFYNSTNGGSWTNNTNWLTEEPASTWYGIRVGEVGNIERVFNLELFDNNLTGNIPSSIGALTELRTLRLENNLLSDTIPLSLGDIPFLEMVWLNNNKFTGSIPSSLARNSGSYSLNLSDNLLTGAIPESFNGISQFSMLLFDNNYLSGFIPWLITNKTFPFSISGNLYTFKDLEYVIDFGPFFTYCCQKNIAIYKRENLLSISSKATTYYATVKLFRDSTLIASQESDTLFEVHNTGNYHIEVTAPWAPDLIEHSDTAYLQITLPATTTTVLKSVKEDSATVVNKGTRNLLMLRPAKGDNALTGKVKNTVTIDSALLTYNNQPYVQRHYDIVPELNAAKAEATVTLFFKQEDFDSYNAYVTENNLNIPLLPTDKTDNGNVRVTQFHGSFRGTSIPDNYDQDSTTVIIPTVYWDYANNWWAVECKVSGFSGFYLSTANLTLPLSLVSFEGSVQKNTVTLAWLTQDEINTQAFIIERSDESLNFYAIGKVDAVAATGSHRYTFRENREADASLFYRLKIIDRDGRFTYSKILLIKAHYNNEWMLYPNPAKDITTIRTNIADVAIKNIIVYDVSGKSVANLTSAPTTSTNQTAINVSGLLKGIYFVIITDTKQYKYTLKLLKQ